MCISRIIQTLGELGYEQFQAPLVDLLVTEVVVTRELRASNGPWLIKWINAVKDTRDREVLLKRAFGFGPYTMSDTDSDEGGEITIDERDVISLKDEGTHYERGNSRNATRSSTLSNENDAFSAKEIGQSYCDTANGKYHRNIDDEINSSRNRDEVDGKVFEESGEHKVLNIDYGDQVGGRVFKTKNERHFQSYTCFTTQDEFGRRYIETPYARVLPDLLEVLKCEVNLLAYKTGNPSC